MPIDLKKTLEKDVTKADCLKIVRYIGNDAGKFRELVSVFLAGPYRVTQRAAWPLSYCVREHPALVRPHLSKILTHLKKPGIHDAVKRNTMRLLQFIDVPVATQGRVADICLGYLLDTKEPIAIRVFSMTVLANIARTQLDIKNELIPIIEDEMPFASAAFRSRGQKILKQLKG